MKRHGQRGAQVTVDGQSSAARIVDPVDPASGALSAPPEEPSSLSSSSPSGLADAGLKRRDRVARVRLSSSEAPCSRMKWG